MNHRNWDDFRTSGQDVESIVIAIATIWLSGEKACGRSSAFLWRHRESRNVLPLLAAPVREQFPQMRRAERQLAHLDAKRRKCRSHGVAGCRGGRAHTDLARS